MEDEPASHYNLTFQHIRREENYFSPYYHHVTIHGLEPSTTYYYQPQVRANEEELIQLVKEQSVGEQLSEKERLEEKALQVLKDVREDEREDEDETFGRQRELMRGCVSSSSGTNTEILSFQTAPSPGLSSAATFAILGDLGHSSHSRDTLSALNQSMDSIDVLLLVGDIAYSFNHPPKWDKLFDVLSDFPITGQRPLQVVPGNQDIEIEDYTGKIFSAYENRFRMPRVKPPELGVYPANSTSFNPTFAPYPLPYLWGNSFYAFTYGAARVVMISAYSSMEPKSEQYSWIVSELQTVNRSVTPW